jgi:hypothetical protein
LVTRGLGHARLLDERAVAESLAAFATGGSVAEATRELAPALDNAEIETRDAHLHAAVTAVADAI